jgi:hypothetical protein
MKRIIFSAFCVGLMVFACVGCTTMDARYPNFVETSEIAWSSVQMREGLSYEEAWLDVLDVLAKRFELEMVSKDGGYIRTGWVNTWESGNGSSSSGVYQVRVTVKFSADTSKVEIKTEAQAQFKNDWRAGYDARLLQTIKTDIMGLLGRTTR